MLFLISCLPYKQGQTRLRAAGKARLTLLLMRKLAMLFEGINTKKMENGIL